jgi:hypothetical protein
MTPDGRFSFHGVAPGEYTITASATGDARLRAGGPLEVTDLWGRGHVAVDGQAISDVVVTLKAGQSLAGRVAFDGSSPPPSLGGSAHVRLTATLQSVRSPSQLGLAPERRASVGPDGRFVITGIIPGRYLLTMSSVTGWFLKSSEIDGHDTLDFPVDVPSDRDIGTALVTFTDRSTYLSGTVTDTNGDPTTDLTVIVFPIDPHYWVAQSRRIQATHTNAAGRYVVQNLPPGDYIVAAMTEIEPGGWYDPELLKTLAGTSSIRLPLAAGEHKIQDVHLK